MFFKYILKSLSLSFIFTFIMINHAFSADKNLKDRLVFKVDTHIYFLSDINTMINKISIFKCALGSSFMLSEYRLDSIDNLKFSENLSLKKKKLKDILKLLKTIKYIEKENLTLSKKARNLFIQAVKTGNCGQVVFDELKFGTLTQFLQAEMYMKRRFHLSHYNISPAEFKKERKDFFRESDKKAMFLIKQRKQKIAIKDFLKTLKIQIKHNEYF